MFKVNDKFTVLYIRNQINEVTDTIVKFNNGTQLIIFRENDVLEVTCYDGTTYKGVFKKLSETTSMVFKYAIYINNEEIYFDIIKSINILFLREEVKSLKLQACRHLNTTGNRVLSVVEKLNQNYFKCNVIKTNDFQKQFALDVEMTMYLGFYVYELKNEFYQEDKFFEEQCINTLKNCGLTHDNLLGMSWTDLFNHCKKKCPDNINRIINTLLKDGKGIEEITKLSDDTYKITYFDIKHWTKTVTYKRNRKTLRYEKVK